MHRLGIKLSSLLFETIKTDKNVRKRRCLNVGNKFSMLFCGDQCLNICTMGMNEQ